MILHLLAHGQLAVPQDPQVFLHSCRHFLGCMHLRNFHEASQVTTTLPFLHLSWFKALLTMLVRTKAFVLSSAGAGSSAVTLISLSLRHKGTHRHSWHLDLRYLKKLTALFHNFFKVYFPGFSLGKLDEIPLNFSHSTFVIRR